MSAAVRVLLYVTDPENAPGSVEAAYHAVSRALDGTPGLVGNTLLRAVDDPRAFAVLSEWTDLSAFRAWEVGSEHRGTTARSEEHTSELQSHVNLVCRLLLEKK